MLYRIGDVRTKVVIPRVTLYLWEKHGLIESVRKTNEQTGNEDRYYNDENLLKIKFLKLLSKRKSARIESLKVLSNFLVDRIKSGSFNEDILRPLLNDMIKGVLK